MSRLPVLIGLVLLVVAVSVLDVSFLPMSWFGNALPYVVVAVVLFLVMSNGACCGGSCRGDSKSEPNADQSA